ncbi:MAG: YbaK/EbsC family protein [Campylobacteraceae bacterium]|jgi:prolyl-tRNA editing enzyme YbaK/EbsC (Cys-tRNA(Pro) deacylase)|nr:YbaK/EbsC family protein [Campylobacteraceae bacterium]
MALDKVKDFFRQFGLEEKIIELDTSSATVELAAKALRCEGKRIAKTLSLKLNDRFILIVMAGDAKIDNAKYRAEFGAKVRMLSADEVLANIGHEVGGVCPFGISGDVDIYLDKSLKRFESVFPACGSRNSAIELDIKSMERYTRNKKWIDVCKDWQTDDF